MGDDSKQSAPAAKRTPPNAGKGRQKGSLNKTTKIIKTAFQDAFDVLGGSQALAEWGEENRTEFYKLAARLIPVQQEVSGPDGGPVQTQNEVVVTFKRPRENQP